MKINNKELKITISKLVKGYILFLKSIIFKVDYKEFDMSFKIFPAVLIVIAIGMVRTILSIGFYGGFDVKLVWIFCMAVFPLFTCFFPAMILDYASKRWDWGIKSRNIFGIFFFAQGLHVIIPLIDRLANILKIRSFALVSLSESLYFKLTLSPLSLTPLTFLVTPVSSLGVIIVWFMVSVFLIKYGIYNKVPKLKFFSVLMIIFYIIYLTTYPTIVINFQYVRSYVPEADFYYSLPFLIGAIGGILYFESKILNKNKL